MFVHLKIYANNLYIFSAAEAKWKTVQGNCFLRPLFVIFILFFMFK